MNVGSLGRVIDAQQGELVAARVSDQCDRVVHGEVHVRKVFDRSVTIDHNVVDGTPAARFGAELRHLVENATVLQST